MSAPPLFQSAGRRGLKFRGEDDWPTVVVCESLSESGLEHRSEKRGRSKDWLVWCRSKKNDKEQRPFEVDGKWIFLNHSKQAKAQAAEKRDKTGGKGQSVRWKAWWRQGNIKCAESNHYAVRWAHHDFDMADKKKTAFKKVAGISGRKDECQVWLKGRWAQR